MTYELYCEADLVAECSQSRSSTRYPVRYFAGHVASVSDIHTLLTPPPVASVFDSSLLGKRTAYIEQTAVRMYHNGKYLLGGYLSALSSEVQWVRPVTHPAQRLQLESLIRELTAKAIHSSYMDYLPRHSAQMLALALVDAPHALSVAYTGAAPERFLTR